MTHRELVGLTEGSQASPPGTYSDQASVGGYVGYLAGQRRRNEGPFAPITLLDGEAEAPQAQDLVGQQGPYTRAQFLAEQGQLTSQPQPTPGEQAN